MCNYFFVLGAKTHNSTFSLSLESLRFVLLDEALTSLFRCSSFLKRLLFCNSFTIGCVLSSFANSIWFENNITIFPFSEMCCCACSKNCGNNSSSKYLDLSIASTNLCFASIQGGLNTIKSALRSQFSNKSPWFNVILSSNPNSLLSLDTLIIEFLLISLAIYF